MIPISLNPKTSQSINYKLTEAYLSKVLTIDDIAMLKEDVPSPYENNNKVLITNDYGNLDYSFLEEYTTDTATNSSGDLIVTDTSGKLDNSFLYSTNSKKANSVVMTDSDGLINYNLLKASVTPTANYIPIANNSNKLNNNWLNNVISSTGASDKDKVVITNSNGKINNNLLNATTTSTSNSLPLSNSDGKINDNWLTTTVTSSPNTILKLDNTGKIDSGVIPSGLFIPLTGGEPTGNIIIQGPNTGSSADMTSLKNKLPNFYGYGANTNTDGFLIGINSTADNASELIIATHDNGNEPIKVIQYSGSQRYANLTENHVVTLMDANGYTSVLKLTSNGDITSTNGALSVKNGITSTNGALSVKNGITSTNGNLSIAGTSTLTGNVTAKGTLSVTGATTLTGKLTANSGIDTTALTTSSTITSTGKITGNGGIGTTSLTTSGNTSIGGTLGVTGNTSLSTLSTSGTATIGGLLTANGKIIIPNGNNISASSYNNPNLTIGSSNSQHLEIDNDEIMSKTNANTAGTLHLQSAGGSVVIGTNKSSNLFVKGNTTIYNNTYIGTSSTAADLNIVNGKIFISSGTTSYTGKVVSQLMGQVGSNDSWRIGGGATAEDYSFLEIATSDNGNEPIYVSQYGDGRVTAFSSLTRRATLLDANGNTSFPGQISSASLSTGPITASAITSSGAVTGTNFTGKWAGYTQDIGTQPSIADSTWILLNNSAKIQHTTIGDIKNHINSSITDKAPMPTASSGVVGQIVAGGCSQKFTPPSGGTWEVWGDIHNSNSTSNGTIYQIVAGGTELDAGWYQTRTNWFAKRIK